MLAPVSLINLLNAVISGFLAWRTLVAYRQHRHDAIKYFGLFYLMFALNWLMAGAPEVIARSPEAVRATNIIAFTFQYVALAAVAQVPFVFADRREWGAVAGVLVATAGIVFVVGRLLTPLPHVRELVGPYVYWRPVMPLWLRVMSGAVSAAVGIGCGATFAYLGWRYRANALIFRRSMYLTAGTAMLLIGLVFAYFVSAVVSFPLLVVASIFADAGLFLMLHGVLYEHRRNAAA
jgi:hypothetical protein